VDPRENSTRVGGFGRRAEVDTTGMRDATVEKIPSERRGVEEYELLIGDPTHSAWWKQSCG
jgi:hypothetical protein